MSNRFFIWPADSPAPVELDPTDESGDYVHRLASQLDAAFTDQPTTFLITWHLDEFDERFRDSVVLLRGDEKYQRPSYASSVRAVFKTGGIRRNPWRATLQLPPSVAWRVLLRDVRNVLVATRRWIRVRGVGADSLFEVPLGYLATGDVPFIPFADRDVDVFFAGSVARKRLTLRPRDAARRQMADALAAARRQVPELRVDYTAAGAFGRPDEMLDTGDYSARVMNSKIALCPRGNFDETLRLTEAARSGCVVIAERLPERWYYRNAPVIQIESWRSLPDVLRSALKDQAALEERSRQTRAWYENCLSERAVARFIAQTLAN